jgi:hypothetical protein
VPIVAHQTDRVARLSLTACPAVEWVWFLTFPDGSLLDIAYADAVVGFIVDSTLEADTERCKTAVWFLLEGEQAFFVICERAGIDAEKLRLHLRNHIVA